MILLTADPNLGPFVAAGIFYLIVSLFIYFIPTIVASGRDHAQTGAIFALNFFLGWTLVGWVAALVWALIKPQPPQVV